MERRGVPRVNLGDDVPLFDISGPDDLYFSIHPEPEIGYGRLSDFRHKR